MPESNEKFVGLSPEMMEQLAKHAVGTAIEKEAIDVDTDSDEPEKSIEQKIADGEVATSGQLSVIEDEINQKLEDSKEKEPESDEEYNAKLYAELRMKSLQDRLEFKEFIDKFGNNGIINSLVSLTVDDKGVDLEDAIFNDMIDNKMNGEILNALQFMGILQLIKFRLVVLKKISNLMAAKNTIETIEKTRGVPQSTKDMQILNVLSQYGFNMSKEKFNLIYTDKLNELERYSKITKDYLDNHSGETDYVTWNRLLDYYHYQMNKLVEYTQHDINTDLFKKKFNQIEEEIAAFNTDRYAIIGPDYERFLNTNKKDIIKSIDKAKMNASKAQPIDEFTSIGAEVSYDVLYDAWSVLYVITGGSSSFTFMIIEYLKRLITSDKPKQNTRARMLLYWLSTIYHDQNEVINDADTLWCELKALRKVFVTVTSVTKIAKNKGYNMNWRFPIEMINKDMDVWKKFIKRVLDAAAEYTETDEDQELNKYVTTAFSHYIYEDEEPNESSEAAVNEDVKNDPDPMDSMSNISFEE